jgi:GNAT superfamily N-acetyltransferase
MSNQSSTVFSKPALLAAVHDVSQFDCGKPALNRWLQNRALSNQRHGFTRVLAVCEGTRVVGFYGLAPTAVDPSIFPRSIRTGQPPTKFPAILIGQLAVDREFAGRGLGAGLLHDALERAVAGARLLSGRAILVDAIDEDAVKFWKANGFRPLPGNNSVLFRSVDDVEQWLATQA